MARQNILIVSPENEFLEDLSQTLEKRGFGAFTAWNLEIARLLIERERIGVVICGSAALLKKGGEFLEWVSRREPQIVTVVLSEWADWEAALTGLERALHFDQETAPEAAAELPDDAHEIRNRLVEDLERSYPGISKLRLDPNGFLIL